jgi:hypothetical protein
MDPEAAPRHEISDLRQRAVEGDRIHRFSSKLGSAKCPAVNESGRNPSVNNVEILLG